MKNILLIGLILFPLIGMADTPPARTINSETYDASGNPIGSTSGSLNVNVTNSGGTSTVNQGTGNGSSPWSVYFLTPPTILSQQSGTWTTGRTWTLLNSTDSVTSYEGGSWNVGVSGTVTSNIGTTGGLALDSTLSTLSGKFTTTVNGLKVDGSAVTQPVSGSVSVSNFPATQPISGTVSVSNFPGTQPVSGTVTANQGTAGASAWKVDGSGVTQPISGSVSVSNFPATQPISGTVTANAGTGTFTVGQSTGSNLHVDVDNFPSVQAVSQNGTWTTGRTWTLLNTTDSVNVGNFPSTFGVTQSTSPWVTSRNWNLSSGSDSVSAAQSGTWNITNITGTVSLPTGAATSANQSTVIANQTNASQKTQIVDGSGNVIASTSNALNVAVTSSSASSGRGTVTNVRNVYSTTPVTTSTFVTLISSTSATTNSIYTFDSSGQTLRLNYAATCGALAAGTNELYITPGGNASQPWTIPASQCVGIQAISTTASGGELDLTLFK